MPVEDWLAAISAAAYLALAILAAMRRSRNPLAIEMGLMCVGLFAYNVEEVLSVVTGSRAWVWIGDAAASLTAIATFELYLGFLGLKGQLLRLKTLARIYFALLALAGLSPLVVPKASVLHDGGVWPGAMLVGLLPCFTIVGVLLTRHLRASTGKERLRAQILVGAMLLGVGSVTTDLAAMAGLGAPRLSYVGLLLASLLVAVFAFETRVIERVSVVAAVNAVVIALLAVLGNVLVLSWAGERVALVAFGSIAIGLASIAALLPTWDSLTEHRSRTQYLLALGRFAEQMAHDIRNPLASIKGSAQFLKEERAQGRSMDPHEEMIDLIVERVDRIERLVKDYQRMGRVVPRRAATDVTRLVRDALGVARAQPGSAAVKVEERFEDGLPEVSVDSDLLGFALENLIRNACEAMPGGGTLKARIAKVDVAGHPGVRVEITDSGEGMNVRTRERALRGFFTTKKTGTGLGLAFVRQVVEAHGGSFAIVSAEGRGTTVGVDLPAG